MIRLIRVPRRTGAAAAALGAICLGTVSGTSAQPAFDATFVPLLDHETRGAVIDSVVTAMRNIYVFPDVGDEMAKRLNDNWTQGEYQDIEGIAEFTTRLTEDLQSISHDLHLSVRVGPPVDPSRDAEAEAAARQGAREEQQRRRNWGFESVQRLEGNVGYIDLRGFVGAEIAGATAISAMNLLRGVDALIFDLRRNGGGDPSMIQLLTSYLLEDRTHLNSFFVRESGETTQFWTQASVQGEKLTDVPVYVLTSNRTFSAAEEFTYNLKNLERATVIGETTGGGAHPVNFHWFDFGEYTVTLSLPFGRAINPITGTNWEGTGVEPHVSVPADEALDVALLDAIRKLHEQADDPAVRAELEWSLHGLEAARHPVSLGDDEMAPYAGTYGERVVTLDGGSLWYRRGDQDPRRLFPLGSHVFGVEGLDYFRIRFVLEDSSLASELVGMYVNGRRDSDARIGP